MTAIEIRPQVFGRLVRCYRLRAGYSQSDLAARIGMKRSNLSATESGRRKPPQTPQAIERWCNLLSMTDAEKHVLLSIAVPAESQDWIEALERTKPKRKEVVSS